MPEKPGKNREQLKEITDRIEAGIRDIFESGDMEKYRNYLRTMSRFHNYSLNNQALIHLQRPDATLVAGYNRWRDKFSRHVLRGEKGITIIAPTPYKKKIEQEKLDPDTKLPILDADGKIVTEEKEIEIPMFRPVKVFDYAQTDGKPLPERVASPVANLTGSVENYEAFMEALRRSSPVPVEFKPLSADMDGYFSPKFQSITLREGMSEVQTVSAAVHEIAHAKLHNYGLQQAAERRHKSRNTEEVEAESISFMVCAYFGIETGANSFGYVATWSKNAELPEFRASLDTISKTANGIITDVEKHFAEVCKERGIELPKDTEYELVTIPPSRADALAFAARPGCGWGDSTLYREGSNADCLDILPLEWSGCGRGDYRESPLELSIGGRAVSTDFRYLGCEVLKEPPPSALPVSRGQTILAVYLEDAAAKLRLTLLYGVLPTTFTRRAILENCGSSAVHIRKCMSACTELPSCTMTASTATRVSIDMTSRKIRVSLPPHGRRDGKTGTGHSRRLCLAFPPLSARACPHRQNGRINDTVRRSEHTSRGRSDDSTERSRCQARRSEHHDEQHLEWLLPIHRVRMSGGHDDALALAEQILLAVDGDAAHAIETGHEGVAAGLVRADLLTLIEGEKRHAQRGVLRERLAYDLPLLIGDLVLERQDLCLGNVLQTGHGNKPPCHAVP